MFNPGSLVEEILARLYARFQLRKGVLDKELWVKTKVVSLLLSNARGTLYANNKN